MYRKILNTSWTRIFLAPDVDPSGGGGNPSGGQQQQQGSQQTEVVDPFKGIDFDDLPPEQRTILEAAKASFTTLQQQNAATKQQAELHAKNERLYQGRLDQLQAQVQQMTGGTQLSKEAKERADGLAQIEKLLIEKRVSPENAKAQAEILYDLQLQERQNILKQVGTDLAPFATLQLQREAEWSFQQAVTLDQTGALQDPEIQKEVWAQTCEAVKNGQQMTPEIIMNLTGMAYFKAINEGRLQPTQQQQQHSYMPPVPQLPNMGRMSAPGGGFAPTRRMAPDPNAARTALNGDTEAALKTVFKDWGKAGEKAPLNGGRK